MRYIMGCIDMVLAGGFGSATVRADVCEDYNRRSQERLKKDGVHAPGGLE